MTDQRTRSPSPSSTREVATEERHRMAFGTQMANLVTGVVILGLLAYSATIFKWF